MPPVTVTWVQGHIRTGDSHYTYGDPYETCGTITRIDDTAYLSGWVGTPKNIKEIIKALLDEGITEVMWERIIDDKHRWVTFDLTKYRDKNET